MRTPRETACQVSRALGLAIALALFSPLLFSGNDEAEGQSASTIHWKPVTEAQVKLDDKTPLGWNVFEPDKKEKKAKRLANTVLLLLGHRYLYLDFDARFVYEVPRASLHAQGQDFETADPPADLHEIPSTDWTLRDVGPAELIRFTLGDYGRTVEVSLPHPPDMRPFY